MEKLKNKLIKWKENKERLENNTKLEKQILTINSEIDVLKNKKEYIEPPESIFILGMPRSGSTLLESILSMNTNVDDLGESNIFI